VKLHWGVEVYFHSFVNSALDRGELSASGNGRFPPGETMCYRLHLKCDGTCAETRFRLSSKRTSQFKSAGVSVQSTAGSRGVRISGSNAGYNKFRGSVKSTGYPLHSPVSPSLSLPASPCAITFQLDSTL